MHRFETVIQMEMSPSLLPEDRNRSSFRSVVFSSYLEFRTVDKVQEHL
jgi:hypothetical protein